MLIPAIGQAPDLTGLDGDRSTVRRDGTFEVDAMRLAPRGPASLPRATRPAGRPSVIEAVAQGNAVARTVDHYLRTGQMPAEKLVTLPGYEVVEQPFNLDDYAEAKRPAACPTCRWPSGKAASGRWNRGWTSTSIQEECKRCLRCDLEWLQEMGLAFQPGGCGTCSESRSSRRR